MGQFLFGLLAGVVVGLIMEWVIDWTGLLPRKRVSTNHAANVRGTPQAAENSTRAPGDEFGAPPMNASIDDASRE